MIGYRYIYIIIMFLVAGCDSNNRQIGNEDTAKEALVDNVLDNAIGFNTITIESDIENIDSVMIIRTNESELFKIALGGNVELLSDTIIKAGGVDVGVLTLADYFQNDQIFYVLYDSKDLALYQSEKLYLPLIEMEIRDYNLLDSITISGDSIMIMSRERPKICTSLCIDTLQCDTNGIINFYEFE